VMAVTGLITQLLLRRSKKKRPKSGQDKPLPEYEVRQINNSERIKH
jgi:hypothetical protein